MYFKTSEAEYRRSNKGWQKRVFGTKDWVDVPKNLWQSIYGLRKSIMGNRRPNIAETATFKLSKYNGQTKKTSRFAYIHGVDLDRLVTK